MDNTNQKPDNQTDENSEEFVNEIAEEQDGALSFADEQDQVNAAEGEDTNSTDSPASESAAIQALQVELDTTKDQLMRALAEAENTRRRALKDREDAGKFAISGFAKDLLNVADNLRRALDAIPDDIKSDERVSTIIEGVEATEKELLRTFERNKIEKLNPLDQPFNPNFHEVMFETPGTGKPGGTVIQVIEEGYILNERLLRPARVGIAKDDGGQGQSHQVDTEA